MCILVTLFFHYLTFDIYYWINQHVAYNMVIQHVQQSWQMFGIRMSFYFEKIDKLFML